MITLEELKQKISPLCQKYRIAYADVFGSIARLEQSPESDLDLIIEFSEPRQKNMSKRFFGFLHDLEDEFKLKVDLLTEKSLQNPILKEQVNQHRVRIYGD